MKKKLFKMMVLTFTMTMLMAGCGAKEEAQEREEKKEQQVEMESGEEVQEDSEVAEPTEEPEEDKALYEDWSEIERLIDLEISKWEEDFDPQGHFDFSLQAHAKDSLKKGRVTSYNITDTGVTFVGRSGIEYHYEYRGYVDNYLKELYTTEVHPGDEYTRRKEMNEK